MMAIKALPHSKALSEASLISLQLSEEVLEAHADKACAPPPKSGRSSAGARGEAAQ